MTKSVAILVTAAFAVTACSESSGGVEHTIALEISSPVPISVPDVVHDVRDIALHPSGGFWVLSSFDPHLFLLSADGVVVSRFGRSGSGPTELAHPTQLLESRSDVLALEVWDAGKRRVERFNESGESTGGLPIPLNPGFISPRISEKSYVNPGRVEPLDNGFVRDVYAGPVSWAADLWTGALVKINQNGEPGDTIIHFAELRGDAAPQNLSEAPPELLAPVPLWVPCSGRIALLSSPREEVIWIDSRGTVVDSQAVDLPEIPVTGTDRSRFLRQQVALEARDEGLDPNSPEMDRLIEQILQSGRAVFAESAPHVNLLCGQKGELWVQLFSTQHDPRGYGRTWIRIDRDGQEIVQFPARFTPLLIEEDRIIGVQTDELGVERVAVSRIDRQG